MSEIKVAPQKLEFPFSNKYRKAIHGYVAGSPFLIVEVEGMMPQPGWDTSKLLDDRTGEVTKYENVKITKKSLDLFIIVSGPH